MGRAFGTAALALGCGGQAPDAPPAPVSRALLAETETLVAKGATWRYLDDGSDQAMVWRAFDFKDDAWKAGPARLGYGGGNEATVVSFGPDPKKKYITTYFRTAFEVADPAKFANLIVRVLHDDGAVMYLNGIEIYRENMPIGVITYRTLANRRAVRNLFIQRNVAAKNLRVGRNLLAVEVHQESVDSTDFAFDLEFKGSEHLALVRGPYLQMGAPRRATIRWRTDLASPGRVRWGTAANALTQNTDDAAVIVDHVVTLSGLRPATKYFYSIGTGEGELEASGRVGNYFVTPPLPGPPQPTRVWVVGDSGRADSNAEAVRNAYVAYAGQRHTDLWLMLGDNAYNEGTDDQYQKAVFELYPDLLRNVFLWPAIGNHETAQATIPANYPYLDIFTLPTKAEAGGVASGSEYYYSFNHANIHFVVLDSMVSSRAVDGAMLTWLDSDLRANMATWLVAYWHHPPYSKGSHNSDVETELVEMRENALPILERYGVDLVLSGHSHSYERSFFIDGHYGASSTFTDALKKQPGNGRPDEGGPYTKAASGPAPHEGTVYVVAGSSGLASPAPLDHPAMFISMAELGSLVLDIDGPNLNAVFLRETGEQADKFSIKKGMAPPRVPPDAGRRVMDAGSDAPAPVVLDAAGGTGGGGGSSIIDGGPAIGQDARGRVGMQTHGGSCAAAPGVGASGAGAVLPVVVVVIGAGFRRRRCPPGSTLTGQRAPGALPGSRSGQAAHQGRCDPRSHAG